MDNDFSTLINNYFQHDYRDRGIKVWRTTTFILQIEK